MLRNLNPQRLIRKYLLRPCCVRKTHEVPYTAERGRDCGKPVCFGARTGSWEFARSSFLPAQSLPSYVMLGKSLPCWGFVLLLSKLEHWKRWSFSETPAQIQTGWNSTIQATVEFGYNGPSPQTQEYTSHFISKPQTTPSQVLQEQMDSHSFRSGPCKE